MAIKKPPIKPVLPVVRPPIEPIEVPEEELPPVEPIEPSVEPVELYPLIARLYPSFPTLKPEGLETKMAELSSLAQEDPEAFLYDLDFRATPEERDFVLRTLGVPEEYFIAEEALEEQRARLTELIAGVYPELTPEEFFDYLETDFASFIDDMQTGGQTAEKLALLNRGLGIPFQSETETDIADIFAQVKMVVPIEDVRQLVTITPEGKAFNKKNQWVGTYNRAAQRFTAVNTNEGWIKDSLIDPWVYAANTVVHSLTQFGSSVLANILFRDLGDIERTIYGDGWVDRVNAGNKVMRDTFRSVNALNQKDFDKWVVKHPELIPKPEWEEGWSEHPELILNPAYIAYEFASTAPITLGVMSLIAGGVVTGAPALGIMAGMALMVPAESADAYQALLNAGAPEDEASKWALLVGTSAGLIEVFSDLLLLKWIAAPIAGLFRKEAVKQMAEATVAHLIKKGVFAYTAVTAIEVIEEELTLAISNAALKVYDENVEIWDGAVRTAAKTFAATTPIALLAGASTMVGISRQQSAQFTDAEKLKEGWTKDPVSQDWFRPKTQEEMVAGLEEAGVIEPEVPEVIPVEVPAVPEATLPLEQVSELETRAPLDLIRKDESAEIERLTKEIQAEGITEPITIRVREDGSQIVWDGLHRLIVAQDLGLENIPVRYIGEIQMLKPKPPAVEVAKPPVEPEIAPITSEQTESINTLAKEKLIMTEEGKTKPQLRRLMKALTGKNRINQLTQAEADLVIEAVGRLEVKYGRPPVIPTGVGLITAEFAEKIPLLKEIGILEKVRPTRHVFEKMGLRQEVWKPAFEAEVRVYEEHQAFDKELNRIGKLVGKERRNLVFRELENPGTQVGLTFDEKRAVTWFRKYFDDWANRLNLPENKRRTNYVTHIFEEEISRELKEKHPIDPELIKALDFITPKTVFNPFLQKRLGQTIGLREDPFAAATAYEARALKVFYYEPLIQRIRVYQKYLPPHSAKYLSDFIKRITNRPLTIDRELNQTVKEFGEKIRGLPGGEALADSLTRGNPGGMVSYNLTSVLYTLWLGYKPTSAIRNLGQHTLIIAEVGPIHFANGIKLRTTQEGRATLKESLVLRSRRGAFIPAIDSSFASKWTDSFREKALWMFRFADKQNVSDAFLAGYSEAKELFPDAPRQLWLDRGDEVAADTQYLYTKFNSFAMSQNSIGRVFSMLTTWTENWLELMTKWISRKPSQVYLAYAKETGQAMPTKNWSQTYKALLMYMLIVGLGYALKEKTRLKAWEYTGITSLRYLADISSGEFPALQAPGAVMDLVVGFVTDDERRLKTGWNKMKSTFIPSIIKQMNYVAEGERDWLTLLLYLEGQDIEIKRLRVKWEKGWVEYPLFKDDEGIYDPDLKLDYIRTHPEHAGWSDAKIRNQWREDNPLLEAQMFIVGKFTVLSTDKARAEVLRLIEEHKIDTELIDGYEKVFGVDTEPELQGFQNRLGNLELLVVGEEAEYFTTSNFATEVNRLVNIQGRSKVERDGHKLAIEYLHATDLWETYYNLEEDDARTLWRQQFPDVEALLYLFGKVSSFKNPKSAEILLGLMKKYNIPPQAIRAFIDKPERYDELFTQKFELEQKWFDQTTEYENFGNTEAPNYIEDKEERKLAREKFKEDNPDWVADMRRIEAIDNDASDVIIERWVERGKTIDEFGAGSSQAKVWLLDNPETHTWALTTDPKNPLLTDDGSDWNVPVLRINVKWAKEDDFYNTGIPDKHKDIENRDERDAVIAEERERYLIANPEYNKDRYRRDARSLVDEKFNRFPEELIETYVNYYTLPKKPDDWLEGISYYEDEWFLQDNPKLHQALVDFGKFKEPRDFSKVPTRDIFKKLWIYNELPTGYERDTYRFENPDLDEWGVSIGMWKTTMSEKRRRLSISERERFLEDVAEKMRELEEMLAGLR